MRELKQAIFELHAAKAKEKALITAVNAAKETLEGVQQEFQVGTRTSLDLLDTQQELFSTETSLIESKYSLILAKYKILESINHLSLSELKKISSVKNSVINKKVDAKESSSALNKKLNKNSASEENLNIIDEIITVQHSSEEQNNKQPGKFRYAVQVAAYDNEYHTGVMFNSLRQKGYNPFVNRSTDSNGRAWQFIWIERFWSYKKAVAAQKLYKEKSRQMLT